MGLEVTNMEISGVKICATWDADAEVFVGLSEDLPGLILEAETIPQIKEEAACVIPELLAATGQIPEGDRDEITIGIEMTPMTTKIAI